MRQHWMLMIIVCLLAVSAAAWADTTQNVAGETEAVLSEANPPAAAGASDTDPAVPTVSDMVVPSLTRIALSLVAIIVIIYAVVFILRRLSGNRLGGGRRGKTIQLIEQTYLAPKKSVCLLKLADRAVLVGITDTQISLLTEMEWEALPQNALRNEADKETGFQGMLNDAVGKLFGAKRKGAGGEQTV